MPRGQRIFVRRGVRDHYVSHPLQVGRCCVFLVSPCMCSCAQQTKQLQRKVNTISKLCQTMCTRKPLFGAARHFYGTDDVLGKIQNLRHTGLFCTRTSAAWSVRQHSLAPPSWYFLEAQIVCKHMLACAVCCFERMWAFCQQIVARAVCHFERKGGLGCHNACRQTSTSYLFIGRKQGRRRTANQIQ